MRQIQFLIIAIVFSLRAFSQDKISGLLLRLHHAPTDSLRMEAYGDIHNYYTYSNPDSDAYYMEDGLKRFSGSNYRDGIGYLSLWLGDNELSHGSEGVVKKRIADALKIFEESGNKKGKADAENSLGNIEGRSGNFDAATKYFIAALNDHPEDKHSDFLSNVYMDLGQVNESTPCWKT